MKNVHPIYNIKVCNVILISSIKCFQEYKELLFYADIDDKKRIGKRSGIEKRILGEIFTEIQVKESIEEEATVEKKGEENVYTIPT